MQKIKLILICLLLTCCLCSCRERGSSEDRVSDGQQSNVGWFLFIFDNLHSSSWSKTWQTAIYQES